MTNDNDHRTAPKSYTQLGRCARRPSDDPGVSPMINDQRMTDARISLPPQLKRHV